MQIIDITYKIDDYLAQAEQIIKSRKYDLGLCSAYYVGEDLHLNIFDNCKLRFLVTIDIMHECYTVMDKNNNEKRKFLLPIKSLKIAFSLYEGRRGRNNYYKYSLSKSCLRHIVDNFNK